MASLSIQFRYPWSASVEWMISCPRGIDTKDAGRRVLRGRDTGTEAVHGIRAGSETGGMATRGRAERLVGTVTYLFWHGPVLKDGDTLGVSEAERFRFSLEGNRMKMTLEVAR